MPHWLLLPGRRGHHAAAVPSRRGLPPGLFSTQQLPRGQRAAKRGPGQLQCLQPRHVSAWHGANNVPPVPGWELLPHPRAVRARALSRGQLQPFTWRCILHCLRPVPCGHHAAGHGGRCLHHAVRRGLRLPSGNHHQLPRYAALGRGLGLRLLALLRVCKLPGTAGTRHCSKHHCAPRRGLHSRVLQACARAE